MAITLAAERAEVTSTVADTQYSGGSYTPGTNAALIAFCCASGSADAGSTAVGNGLTWTTEVNPIRGTVLTSGIFSALTGASPTNSAFLYQIPSDAGTGAGITVLEFAGVDLTDAVVQAIGNNGAAGSAPSVTFAAPVTSGNAVVMGFEDANLNPATAAAPVGYTDATSNGWNNPTTGWRVVYHLSPGTPTTVTFAGNSTGNWVAAAAEIKAAAAATKGFPFPRRDQTVRLIDS